MKDKIVTVFGASGFLGRYIVEELAQAGFRVRAVARNIEKCKHLKTAGFVGQVVPVTGDIDDYKNFADLIKNSYAVVNVVGILTETSKQKFAAIHAQMPEKLAHEAKKQSVEKFVHVSVIVDENSKSRYAQSKLAGEKAVLHEFPEAVILRPSLVFGAEDNFFNQFAMLTKLLPFLPIFGGGKTRFQPVYVGDIARAVVHCVAQKHQGIFELGGPKIYSFRKLLKMVMKFTKRKRLLLPIPYFIASVIAKMPLAPLTTDQLKLLRSDSIVHENARSLSALGIRATSIYAVVPKYIR